MDRNLDGLYFRVKRNDKWESVCLSDMTEEIDTILKDRNPEWLKDLCKGLIGTIRKIGSTILILQVNDKGEIEYED